jgi:hypothetical protein
MLGKFLLTLAVIAVAFFVLRQRQIAESSESEARQASPKKVVDNATDDGGLAADLRVAAYMFLGLMVGLGGIMYYFSWQDDHTVLTVNLHRASQDQPVSYQVYKYQLQDRSFITTEGISVTVASSERMEVLGLDL